MSAVADPGEDAKAEAPAKPKRPTIYRHHKTVRLTHWINALVVILLILSGINILAAHPQLYWGSQSDFAHPWVRFTNIRNWPKWPALRDLAGARNWHFFLAWLFVVNGLAYIGYGFWSAHFRRDLVPTKAELRAIPEVAKEHAKLHFPHHRRYNVLQQLAYLGVIFVLLPLMVLTGLTMSPGFDAWTHNLLQLFGGRQSARSIHFISAALITGFIFVHLALVVLSGLRNNVVSMITGKYEVEPEEAEPAKETEKAP